MKKKRFNGIIHLYWTVYYWLLTKKSPEGVEYIWKRRGSDKLIIVFTSMVGRYNFMRTLKKIPIDQLFIRDCWADNASYYWFEGKEDYPERYTQSLIEHVLCNGSYKNIITLGSSKGGSAAIYYGLKNNVDLVFAGACQYKVGDYLARHQYSTKPWQWEKVVGGKPTQEWIDILDHKMEKMIESSVNSKTKIKLIYSTEEHTYPEHIVYLVNELDKCGIQHEDDVESFPDHSMVGEFVVKAVMDYFSAK